VEQSRLLIAFVVSLVIVVIYQKLVLSRYEKARPAATQPAPPRPEEPAAPAAIEHQPPATGELAAPAGEEGLIRVETDVFRIAITPVGGRLADLELKAYQRTVERDSPPLDLVQPGPILPGTLALGENSSDAAVRYRADRTELDLQGSEAGDIVLVGEGPTGMQLQKRYHFTGSEYLFGVTATASGTAVPTSIGLVLTPLPVDSPRAKEAAIALSGRVVEKPITDLLKAPIHVDSPAWAGFAAQYFLAAGLPAGGSAPATFTAVDGVPIVRLETPLSDGQARFDVYAGPKDREILTRSA